MYKIVGTETCEWCERAKNVLARCNQEYEYETITMSEAKERGYKTVPQIWKGDNHIGGYTDLYARLSRQFMYI